MQFKIFFATFLLALSASAKITLEATCRKEAEALLPAKSAEKFWWQTWIVKDDEKIPGWRSLVLKSKTAYEYAAQKDRVFISISRLGEKGKLYSFRSPACQAETSSYAPQPTRWPNPKDEQFTDLDLASLVQAHPWGVIYVWTAGMPLSIRAIPEIKKAVQEKGGYLTILYDSRSRVSDLPALAARNGLTVQDIRRVASDEMMARGVGLHYPAALIYSNGILSPHSYLGYKKARVYSNWIALEMERLGRMEP